MIEWYNDCTVIDIMSNILIAIGTMIDIMSDILIAIGSMIDIMSDTMIVRYSDRYNE